MWTNEGTLIRPGPGSQPFLCLQRWGDGPRGLRVFRDNVTYSGVTGVPVHCGALGQGKTPGLAAPSCLGFLLEDLSPSSRGLGDSIPKLAGSG